MEKCHNARHYDKIVFMVRILTRLCVKFPNLNTNDTIFSIPDSIGTCLFYYIYFLQCSLYIYALYIYIYIFFFFFFFFFFCV